MKVLVTRTDRLGDLVLALPVLDFLRTVKPEWRLQMLVAPGLEAVAAGHPAVDEVHAWSADMKPGLRRQLAEELGTRGFEAVLMLQYRRELALFLRRVRAGRIWGPYSKPSSWFLLHGGVRQGRSRSGRHEMDLNLELAAAMAGLSVEQRQRALADVRRPRVHPGADQESWAAGWRAKEAPGASRVVFIHPGSGGSALDWGPERYAEVANKLARLPGARVFVTGSAADARMIRDVKLHLDERVRVLLERFTLARFMAVLGTGDVLVAPSTGPLHLAAAVGTPTVGLFPPAPVMNPVRWGQRGPHAVHLTPEVSCPAKRRCTREKCRFYNCLQDIAADEVVRRVKRILDETPARCRTQEEAGHDG